MYIGFWNENTEYKRGDIVYVDEFKEYYICDLDHKSDNYFLPSKEDLYWIYISNVFLSDLIQSSNKNTKNTLKIAIPKKNTSKNVEKSFSDNEEYTENKNGLKRKLKSIEKDLDDYKRKKVCKDNNVNSLRDKLLLMDLNIDTKTFLIDKYDSTQKMTGSDYSKSMNWLRTVSKIPYGKYKQLPVNITNSQEQIKDFFKTVKSKLDKNIYGLEDVKQEILEFVAKKITNPNSKGHVLALYGHAGVGKTKIIRSLADALELPFYQINFGGLNDAAVLIGHSETYVGSKPGKIAEIITNSDYMNPIIYLDEIDKISESKSAEIFGILTHLLDEEQNIAFQDNYLSNVHIDLSKVFFVLAFNDITRVDEIVSDRLKIIYIDPPCLQDKVIICQEKMIPEIIKSINLKDDYIIIIDKEVIEYIILNKTTQENGVRQLRKNIEKIVNRLNYDILIGNLDRLKIEKCLDNKNQMIVVTRSYIDEILKSHENDKSYMNMYI
jgi:ATP-dependent Lon protease